ncbi:endonuclease/exonuclease/phosphatase family metal-dependent hydrolase [Microbacterium halimionae]|uniref:Endonuclease/exonuclease/phosphatase family metal-dependent hydrolase n=1 Tax=Microbacterium halimionae TaxID=1526413 RepID=A0A7W3PMA4_9MICO|nr:endonuclease/exonuclease/phosphatase family protein [Microbacterium halimionae]MBA8816866.1 endonuclease/exonuclease/phosphatase family metal-dependent hydrolase [Microbacterium halimionae]NII94838.1 endonuclease/exonuclease/phosphatase family metal-dependent hydrolase [Microbacterium halimionae]
MKVISYNLRKHKAVGEIAALVESHAADVLCLQEADTTDIPAQFGELRLADATRRNRLGLAVYYRESTFRLEEVCTMALKKSLHDRVLRPAEERMLGVRLHDIDHGRDLIVASFHAAPLTALNSLRRHQIRTALAQLQTLGTELPVLMVGDYNYPVFKENLGIKVRDQGYQLTLSDARTYTRYRFFRGHYDFATSTGFDISRIRTLPQGLSDHLPILVDAELEAAAAKLA